MTMMSFGCHVFVPSRDDDEFRSYLIGMASDKFHNLVVEIHVSATCIILSVYIFLNGIL